MGIARRRYKKRADDGCVRQVYSFFLRPDTIARLDQYVDNYGFANRAAAVEWLLRGTLKNVILLVHEKDSDADQGT